MTRTNRHLCLAIFFYLAVSAATPNLFAAGRQSLDARLEPAERERVSALIQQLGDPQFMQRELAVAELRAYGPRAFYLLSAQKDATDAEIRSRVRQLLTELTPTILRLGVRTSELPYIQDYDRLSGDERRLRIRDLGTLLMPEFGCTVLLRIATAEQDERMAKVAAAAVMWQPVPTDLAIRQLLQQQLDGIQGRRVSLRWLNEYARALEDPQGSIAAFDKLVAEERMLLQNAPLDTDEVDIVGPLERFTIDLRMRAALTPAAIDRTLELFEKENVDSVQRSELVRWLFQARFFELLGVLGEKHSDWFVGHRFCQYLLAAAAKAIADDAQAQQLSQQAFDSAGSDVDRLDVAYQLRSAGLNEWSEREYRSVCQRDGKFVESAEASEAIDALHNILHQQQRHKECYELLEGLIDQLEEAHPAGRLERALGLDLQTAKLRIAYQKGLQAQLDGDETKAIGYFRDALPYATLNSDVLCDAFRIEDTEFRALVDQLKQGIIDQHRQSILKRERSISAQTRQFYEQRIAEDCNELAWIMINTGEDVEAALRYAQRSVDLRPGLGHSLDTLAVCHFEHGDAELALQYERQALKLLPYREDIQRTLKRLE